MVLQAAGQQHGHRVLRAHAQVVQQVGRLVDAGEQLGVRPADGLGGRVGRGQKGQRRLVAKRMGRVHEDFVRALHRQCLSQGMGFEPLHVLQAAHRGTGSKRSVERGHLREAHGVSRVLSECGSVTDGGRMRPRPTRPRPPRGHSLSVCQRKSSHADVREG